MLIVNQNHNTVLNLENIESIEIGASNTIRAFLGCNFDGDERYYEIAYYENESKAKRVLENLWSAYANGEKVFIMPEK